MPGDNSLVAVGSFTCAEYVLHTGPWVFASSERLVSKTTHNTSGLMAGGKVQAPNGNQTRTLSISSRTRYHKTTLVGGQSEKKARGRGVGRGGGGGVRARKQNPDGLIICMKKYSFFYFLFYRFKERERETDRQTDRQRKRQTD